MRKKRMKQKAQQTWKKSRIPRKVLVREHAKTFWTQGALKWVHAINKVISSHFQHDAVRNQHVGWKFFFLKNIKNIRTIWGLLCASLPFHHGKQFSLGWWQDPRAASHEQMASAGPSGRCWPHAMRTPTWRPAKVETCRAVACCSWPQLHV